jgi:hypothetical protein
VAHPVVSVALGGVPERVVGRLEGGELGLCAVVVVEIGMVLPHLLPERGLDLLL